MPLCLRIADLRHKFTVNCSACEGKSYTRHWVAVSQERSSRELPDIDRENCSDASGVKTVSLRRGSKRRRRHV